MSQKKILIVDDEQINITVLERALRKMDYDIISAVDGEEAWSKAKDEDPDLIILDLMLPKMDGYKVCGLLKSDMRYKKIPIIFCSGRADQEDKDLAKEVGGDSYILKPIDLDFLFQEIERLLK